jgi:UDP-N-acetylmuramoyl-tripeptide--D-alanyl-D-alanine ligase
MHYIFAALWVVSSVCTYIDFLYYWQLKEYRLDRMADFFRSVHGQEYLLSYKVLYRMALASFLLLLPVNGLYLAWVVIALYGLDTVVLLRGLIRRTVRIPRRTAKMFVLVGLVLLLDLVLLLGEGAWDGVFMVFALRPLLAAVVVILFQLPTTWIKRSIIFLATKKMQRYPKMIVIGITGSYGKSTVKEMLSYVLGEQFRVWKTPKNTNTDIGVAQLILKSQLRDIDVMVVEMGAYKIGEIKAICDIVHPKVGILTAINEQHISLFGSIKHTQKAKYELLESVQSGGVAVVNSDNEHIREKLHTLSVPILSFGWEDQQNPTCNIDDAHETLSGTMVTCVMGADQKKYEVHIPLIGAHHAMNIAPVLLVAQHLGMSVETAVERFKTLPQPGRGLTLRQFGQSVIIDDSYNSNPDGFRAALNVLSRFPGNMRRVVVTRGMIELGGESDRIHETIAGEIAFVADELILVTKDQEAPMRKGAISDKYKLDVSLKDVPNQLLAHLEQYEQTPAVILFENRIPGAVYTSIIDRCTPFISNT